MSLRDRWFYERFVPELGTNEERLDAPIFHGQVTEDHGNGFFSLQICLEDGQSVTRIMNVADMTDLVFFTTFDELQEAIQSWRDVLKQGAELDKMMSDLRGKITDI